MKQNSKIFTIREDYLILGMHIFVVDVLDSEHNQDTDCRFIVKSAFKSYPQKAKKARIRLELKGKNRTLEIQI